MRQAAQRWTAAMLALGTICIVTFAVFALAFPPLSGRVVDAAHILSATQQQALTDKLAELERKSGIQLVVATVASLEGQEIAPYANQLFRTWALGQKVRNNGVLLLVAPNERRVRIEVGYGLEGTLTDALSTVVIANAITPRFKTGDYDGGVARGVDDVITILTTDSADWHATLPDLRPDTGPAPLSGTQALLIFLAIALVIVLSIISPTFRFILFQILQGIAISGGNGRSYRSDSGGFTGGFSGGGGSSGGGGASGSW